MLRIAPGVYVDKYPVTAEQYRAFLAIVGSARVWRNPYANWEKCLQFPVTNVSREDADAYANWCGKRLLALQEWRLAAACGSETPRMFPWGNEFQSRLCNSLEYWKLEKGLYPPKAEPTEVTRFEPQNEAGFCDIVGNVFQIVFDRTAGGWWIVGGCHQNDSARMRIAAAPERYGFATNCVGFRCAADEKFEM